MMLLPCSNNGLLSTLASAVYFLIVLSTCSTKKCGLQLTEKMKRGSVVFRNVDMRLCQTKCIEYSFIFASCHRLGDEPKKIKKVPSKSCGSKVCNETSQCLDEGCKKVCVEAPPLCDLHTASQTGDLSKVIFVLSQGRAEINCQEWIGRTPVMWAAGGGHREVVLWLESEGAKLTLLDSFGFNILHSACLGGDVEVVKYVLSQTMLSINGRVQCGGTAVMLAAENGHKDVVALLVDTGADVSLVDETGDNILHCACRGGDVEVVKYILSHKMVDINSLGHHKKTPVIVAGQYGHKEVVELLVKHGADLSLRDRRRNNILHYASENGHLAVVKYIISLHRVDIDNGGFERKTPVMLAGQEGHKDVVEFLVKHGADLSLRDKVGDKILHLACMKGRLAVVKYIISLHRVDIDSGGFERKTPVMLAGQEGHKDVVEFLVKHGADLSLRDSDTNNILHLTSYGGSLDVMKYVLSQHKVDINGRGWRNRPPVIVAGKEGYKDLVELFVKYGAKLSLIDRRRNNVLHCASENGHLAVVTYIVSLHRVDINRGGFERKTPVMLAGHKGHKDVVEFLEKHGAILSLRDSDTNNILHLTSYGGSVDVMKYVLSQSVVDVNQRGWKKRTPVMIAGKEGYKDLVELLVKHGANLSLADREGNNILLLAVKHVEVVKYILSLGVVDVDAKNRKRQSAAMRARSQGQRDVLDLLVSHGARV